MPAPNAKTGGDLPEDFSGTQWVLLGTDVDATMLVFVDNRKVVAYTVEPERRLEGIYRFSDEELTLRFEDDEGDVDELVGRLEKGALTLWIADDPTDTHTARRICTETDPG